MNKFEDYVNMTKINKLLGREEEKKTHPLLWVLAVVGAVAAVAAIAYGVYRYFTPDYLEDFDDDFDDDFFEDEDEDYNNEELSGESDKK